MWVLIRLVYGKESSPPEYVAEDEHDMTFTHDLEKAWVFNTKSEARAEALGDERPIAMEDGE